MKKKGKGTPGYLDYKKKVEIIRTVIYFGIVAAIFILGYTQTGTRLNVLTVVAILGCLPASKALVGVITRLPYRSIDRTKAEEIAGRTGHLTVCYDMIITSREKVMPADCIVISNHHVFGYTHYEKTDLKKLEEHIRALLAEGNYKGFTVKFLREYKPFLSRAEGLDNIASVEKSGGKEQEEEIRRIILSSSM